VLQDEITEQVVALGPDVGSGRSFDQLRGNSQTVAGSTHEPELYAAEHFRSQRKPPENLDAWECVIRALSHVGEVTRAGMAEAEALCRRAIAIR
jgi:hypothetical protein